MSEQARVRVYDYRRWSFADLHAFMGERWHDMPERHWREAGLMKDAMPLDIDVERYKLLDKTGAFKVFAMMFGGEPVGYAAYFVSPHLHYKSTVWAVSDTFYIAPEHRTLFTAIGLFRFVEQCLREDGAEMMHTTTETSIPGAAKVLKYLGHVEAEVACVKSLRDA
jgi:hypothetical protein